MASLRKCAQLHRSARQADPFPFKKELVSKLGFFDRLVVLKNSDRANGFASDKLIYH